MKKVLVIHPLKHHVYNSIYGISKSNCSVSALLGIYNNSLIIKKILKILKKDNQLKGYEKKEITKYIKTDFLTQIFFLISKTNSRFNEKYSNRFQKISKKFINKSNIIHVLQDYCNESIRYAKDKNKIIVYEQIIGFDTTIKKYIEEEVQKWNFSKSYLDRNYNYRKIEKSKENIISADYILSPSEFVTSSLTNEFGTKILDKIVKIPYGVDIQKFNYIEKSFKNEKLNILCVSRVTLTKGTKYLIEAMRRMENLNIHLTYIGKPVDQEDNKLVDELKKIKNVTYISHVAHSEIQSYFKRSDIFILPSLIEGSALSIYEALASGLPCIVTENSGSVINSEKEGFIIKPQSIDDIVEKINFCNSNRDILCKMSISARKTATNYTWEKYSENIKTFYENIDSSI